MLWLLLTACFLLGARLKGFGQDSRLVCYFPSPRIFLSTWSWMIFLRTKQFSVSCPIARWNLQNCSLNLPMIDGGSMTFGKRTMPFASRFSKTVSSFWSRGVNFRSVLQSLCFGFSFSFPLCWGLDWRGRSFRLAGSFLVLDSGSSNSIFVIIFWNILYMTGSISSSFVWSCFLTSLRELISSTLLGVCSPSRLCLNHGEKCQCFL